MIQSKGWLLLLLRGVKVKETLQTSAAVLDPAHDFFCGETWWRALHDVLMSLRRRSVLPAMRSTTRHTHHYLFLLAYLLQCNGLYEVDKRLVNG
jgi:hypothetical protein